ASIDARRPGLDGWGRRGAKSRDACGTGIQGACLCAPLPSGILLRMPKPKARPGWRPPWHEFMEPYVQMWRALTPDQRLRRSWRLRTRIKNLKRVHDAKTFPKL